MSKDSNWELSDKIKEASDKLKDMIIPIIADLEWAKVEANNEKIIIYYYKKDDGEWPDTFGEESNG